MLHWVEPGRWLQLSDYLDPGSVVPPSVPSPFALEAVGHQPEGRKGTEAEIRVQTIVNMAECPLETAAESQAYFMVPGISI